MHLDFIAEGIKEELDEFEKWWATRMVPMPVAKNGQTFKPLVQMGLRPRRAYTLIFPKEMLQPVLNTLNLENCEVSRVDGKGTKQFGTLLNLFRKILRLKKIPTKDPTQGIIPIRPFNNVRVVGLGIREDIDITEADGGVHEGL